MHQYGPSTFGNLNAGTYDDHNKIDAAALLAVETLADLARGGPVLELAIGTGRLALPLAAKGLSVSGVEASPEMVARLKDKPGGDAIDVVIGDMAETSLDHEFSLVFLVFNTLFNLTTQEAQVRCFENAARSTAPGGVFVLEAFIPGAEHFVDRERVRAASISFEGVVLEAAIHDPSTQRIDYQYITAGQKGMRVTPLPMRYVWPSEMDLMARLAGLRLRHRWAGWDRSPFVASSTAHVSVYEKPQN